MALVVARSVAVVGVAEVGAGRRRCWSSPTASPAWVEVAQGRRWRTVCRYLASPRRCNTHGISSEMVLCRTYHISLWIFLVAGWCAPGTAGTAGPSSVAVLPPGSPGCCRRCCCFAAGQGVSHVCLPMMFGDAAPIVVALVIPRGMRSMGREGWHPSRAEVGHAVALCKALQRESSKDASL